MGSLGYGIDTDILEKLSVDLKAIADLGIQLCLVVGGGNIFRGMSGASKGMNRASADYMGMLATVMNALALQGALQKLKIDARVVSAIPMPPICESYEQTRAFQLLDQGRVVIFAAGTGDPFFTTDTAAALRAAEMQCEVILKGTQVDGVYSSDPKRNKDAIRYKTLSYQEVLTKKLKVMDATAIALAEENNIPVLVFSMHAPEAFKNVILGKGVYTKISND